MQASGLKVQTLEEDTKIRKLLRPVATFDIEGKDEFIAIAEGVDMPVYAFTYQVEMI